MESDAKRTFLHSPLAHSISFFLKPYLLGFFFSGFSLISKNHHLAFYLHMELKLSIQDKEPPLLRSLDCLLRPRLTTFTSRKVLSVPAQTFLAGVQTPSTSQQLFMSRSSGHQRDGPVRPGVGCLLYTGTPFLHRCAWGLSPQEPHGLLWSLGPLLSETPGAPLSVPVS